MRNNADIASELEAVVSLNRMHLERIVELSLEQIASLMMERHPDATHLVVDHTDQDYSGALASTEYLNAAGEVITLDDDVVDELASPLSNLDDLTIDSWRMYCKDGISKFSGPTPLDLAQIREAIADSDASDPDLALLRALATCLKDGEPTDDGEMFVMEDHDAVETLHAFITDARRVLGIEVQP